MDPDREHLAEQAYLEAEKQEILMSISVYENYADYLNNLTFLNEDLDYSPLDLEP